MKHKMWSRLLSMALAVMMIASIVPNSAFAEAASEIVASSQAVAEVVEGTEEVTQPEETTGEEPAEQPAGETASDEEPVAEPSTEPAVESEQPTTEPTQAPAETAVSSEQPSAEPSAAPEGTQTPEGTEAPEGTAVPSETPAASATPAPSESPVPSETPAPSEEPAIDGQALLDELMAIEDDEAFLKAVSELTEEQTAALEALGEEALADYALRVETLTVAQQQEEKFTELYEKLMAAESIQEIEELLNDYSDEELNSFVDFLGEARYTELTGYITAKAAEDQEAPVSKVFTDAGPLMPAVTVGRQSFRAVANFLNADGGNAGEDALKISKTLEGWNKDTGTGTLVLEAYSVGEYKTEIVEKAVPVDIVLVLDQSGSMQYGFDGNSASYVDSRQYAMQEAVTSFISEVQKQYDSSKNADHRMSIVEFSSGARTLKDWTYVDQNGANALITTINDLGKNPSGATNVAAGMSKAVDLIESSKDYVGNNNERKQVVIVFTDGVPTTQSDFDTNVANEAIKYAKSLKDQSVTIYSIGVFDGVNKDSLYGEKWGYAIYDDIPCTGEVGSYWGGSWLDGIVNHNDFATVDIAAGNRFLNYLSSNFQSATGIGVTKGSFNPGGHLLGSGTGYKIDQNFTRNDDKYYLTATDKTSLNKIFETIKDEIGSGSTSVTLDEESVVRDVMSPYFDVKGDVKVYAVPSTGKDSQSGEFQFNDDKGTWILLPDAAEVTGKVVDVSGFDFSTRYVAEEARENPQTNTKDYYGEKLRIEIPITVDYTKTLGGNGIPTNDASSGIYMTKESETPEKVFESPKADVNINYGFETSNTSIYVKQSQDLRELFGENVVYQNTPVPVNGNTNKYVNITYQVYAGGTLVGTYKIDANQSVGSWSENSGNVSPSECTEYTVKCSVTPTAEGSASAWTKDLKSSVHVFLPTITWKDGTVKYNETLTKEYLEGRQVSVVWMDSKSDNGTKPVGSEPVLTYGFVKDGSSLVDTKVTSDIDVSVKVFYGDGTEITGYTRFGWEKDTDKGNVCDDACTQPEGFQFRIHVGTGDLTIAKTLNSFNASKGEKVTFLFEVRNVETNQQYYQAINFSAADVGTEKTVTIKNLPSGTYEVTELTANGYSVVDGSNVISDLVVGTQEPAKAVFTNQSNGDNKPGDNDFANNQFTYDGKSWNWKRVG